MRLAIVVYAVSAALTIATIVKLLQRGGGAIFEAPATIVEHTTWMEDPIRKLPALLPRVAKIIPRGATVACFEPVNGAVGSDYCSLVANGYLLRQRVVSSADADWIVAVTKPFDDPRFELVATYPEGRLYKRRQ